MFDTWESKTHTDGGYTHWYLTMQRLVTGAYQARLTTCGTDSWGRDADWNQKKVWSGIGGWEDLVSQAKKKVK